jgi:hypothetical protein
VTVVTSQSILSLLTKIFLGLTGMDLDSCLKTPGDTLYADRMKGCFAQFQKDIADNKDVIIIVSATIIAFLVRSFTGVGRLFTCGPIRIYFLCTSLIILYGAFFTIISYLVIFNATLYDIKYPQNW